MLCFLCRRVLKNRAEVPKPLLLEEKELVHSTDGKKISVHSSKGLAIGEITVHETARPDLLHYCASNSSA